MHGWLELRDRLWICSIKMLWEGCFCHCEFLARIVTGIESLCAAEVVRLPHTPPVWLLGFLHNNIMTHSVFLSIVCCMWCYCRCEYNVKPPFSLTCSRCSVCSSCAPSWPTAASWPCLSRRTGPNTWSKYTCLSVFGQLYPSLKAQSTLGGDSHTLSNCCWM